MFTIENKHMSLREIIHEVDPFEEMHLLERIELAMLLAAGTGDVSVSTMAACLDAEQEIEFPICEDNDSLIDTEMVYCIVDEVVPKILKERYN